MTLYYSTAPRRVIVGQGCPCGWDHHEPRPKASANRTMSWRKRSGTKREKRYARG